MRNRRWWWAGGTLAVVALSAAVAMKAGGKAPSKADKPEVPLEFTAQEVAQPQAARLASRLEFSGPLVAPSTAVVRAKAPGTLLELRVAEGSRVQAGQVLGRIDLAEQASRVAERHAGVESARAALAQAERTHASNEGLAAQQFISAVALNNSRAAVESARAALAAAQASADTARLGLRDGSLVAPIGGIVAKRQALPGEKLAMEQPVLTLVDLATLELQASVGTHEVSRLAPGQPVQVLVEGVAEPLAGRIARIAPAAEPGTRSIGVAIALANPGERLRAGQYAVARLELPGEAERLTLPLAAVGQAAGQDHVWVIEGGKLARRGVMLGRRDEREGRVEVLEGLNPGAQVLAARFDNLREGARASVVAAKGPPVASAAASVPVVR
ncbi:MAG: efflux RND transporter periplasmic adaptor subunit [Rubrivivax sp.]|nr:efflux RND transporter periplasmic adaptor subunit [Rubrivivax sp.]